MAKILGLPFDDYVDKQVNIRQTKLAKTQKDPEDLVVFNSNTAWVRLSSGVKIEPDKAATLSTKLGVSQGEIVGTRLASKLVLFGGSAGYSNISGSVTFDGGRGGVGYGLNNAYGFLTTSDQGLKPPPGITNISSAYKNNGSLRQAQVSIKCYSRSQFEALEAIYLRLGYTVVLEWGNSVYFDNNGNVQQTQVHLVPNVLYVNEENVDPDTVREKIQKNKIDAACNYDAMMAKVSNFSWNLNEDLSFDIKLDLISVGDIIDSLKANLGGSAGAVSIQIEASGSIQNLVNIVVNKEVSKVNKLFYEMYDEVFKDLLGKFGSPENKKAIEQVNNVEKTVGIVDEIKNKYNTALFDKLYEPYNLAIEAANIGNFTQPERFKSDKTVADYRTSTRFAELARLFSTTPEKLSLLVNETGFSEQLDGYKAAVDAIKQYFDTLKPQTTNEGKATFDYLINSKEPLKDLVRVLNTKYLDEDKKFKIPDGEYTVAFATAFITAVEDVFLKEYGYNS